MRKFKAKRTKTKSLNLNKNNVAITFQKSIPKIVIYFNICNRIIMATDFEEIEKSIV